jgi:hypothetical protein
VALRKSWNIQPNFRCPAGKGGALYAAFCSASTEVTCANSRIDKQIRAATAPLHEFAELTALTSAARLEAANTLRRPEIPDDGMSARTFARIGERH